MDDYIELVEYQSIEKINEACLDEYSLGMIQGLILGVFLTLCCWSYYNNQIRR